MKLAVLSGKGGAGKTFVATNLAYVGKQVVYVDCDVEEPNGHLFLKPVYQEEESVYKMLPKFDVNKCNGCRACVDFCRFHALLYLMNRPILFPDVCHSCKGCMLVCKQDAVLEDKKEIGQVKIGKAETLHVITGVLNPTESSGNPIIKQAIAKAESFHQNIVLDCPPGSACSVMETIEDVDYCLLVVEPTAFGFHNFQMVYELATLLHRRCGVIINKEEEPYQPLYDFCKEHNLPILQRIPYHQETAQKTAQGILASSYDETLFACFQQVWEQVKEVVG